MKVCAGEGPRLLHVLPGRARVHLPAWSGRHRLRLEARILQFAGVTQVRAEPVTGNVLIHFDPRATSVSTLLTALQTLSLRSPLVGAASRAALFGPARLAGPTSVGAANRRGGANPSWWAIARLLLEVAEVLAVVFAGGRLPLVLGSVNTLLRLSAVLVRQPA